MEKHLLLGFIHYMSYGKAGKWRRHKYISKHLTNLVENGKSWCCADCGKNLEEDIITGIKYKWSVNHIDKNHSNDDDVNLELLCWPCHHKYHSLERKLGNKKAWEEGRMSSRIMSEDGRRRNSESRKRAWAEGKYANRSK